MCKQISAKSGCVKTKIGCESEFSPPHRTLAMEHWPNLPLLSLNNWRRTVDDLEEEEELDEVQIARRKAKRINDLYLTRTKSVTYQLYKAAENSGWTHTDTIPLLPGEHPAWSARMPNAEDEQMKKRQWARYLSTWRTNLMTWAEYIVSVYTQYEDNLKSGTRLSDNQVHDLETQMKSLAKERKDVRDFHAALDAAAKKA